MDLHTSIPVPRLRDFVSRITSYREGASPGLAQLEAASLTVPLIIGFSAPFWMAHGREPGDMDRYVSFVGGLSTEPVLVRSRGDCHCLQIDFTPLGAYRFFGLPMHHLTDRIVPLDDLADKGLRELAQRLGEVDDWNVRHRLAEDFIAGRIDEREQSNRPVTQAYERLLATNGMMPVERLAMRLGWSRKHLAQRFREEIGLPPKSIARIARFTRARALATHAPWAEIAAECGYSDQAHLVREFIGFSGLTPTALARR